MVFTESLKKHEDFLTVYKKGKSFAVRELVLYACPNGREENRLGISVSKKVGNSVVRHRITRLIRESYRLSEDRFEKGNDLAVIARINAKGATYDEIRSALLFAAEKLNVLSESSDEKNTDCNDSFLPEEHFPL